MEGKMQIGNFKVTTEDPSAYLRQISPITKVLVLGIFPLLRAGLSDIFHMITSGTARPAVKCDVEDTEAFKDVDLMLFDKVIAFDHLRQKIILIVNMPLDDVETGYNKAVMELKQLVELIRHGEKKKEPEGRLLGAVNAAVRQRRVLRNG